MRFIAWLIERIKRWWRGAEPVEDPSVGLRRTVIEAQGLLVDARKATSLAVADERRLKKRVEEQAELSVLWERKAVEVADGGEDDLARLALERKAEHDDLRSDYEKKWRLQREAVEVMKRRLRILHDGVETLRVRRNVSPAWPVLARARSLCAELRAFVETNAPPPASANGPPNPAIRR